MTATPKRTEAIKQRVQRQLELLSLRCLDLADRVAAGELPFIDSVDAAYHAALAADLPSAIEASGLINTDILTGDDVVQSVLAGAFANARRPA